ncbi:MAG: hypothetical protein ABI877_23120 [Gemmatimonadaceae bacterium]
MPISALLFTAVITACGGGAGGTEPPPADTTLIGPAGGTVTDAGGTIVLTIPANAVTTPTRITVGATLENFVDAALVNSSRIRVQPDGLQFTAPATLTFPYSAADGPSGTRETDLKVVSRNGSAWSLVPAGSVDAAAHVATAQITTTGAYAVRWYPPAGACSTEESRQFDFWIGDWNFTAPNAFPGTNTITKDASGCFLEENFHDSNNARGRSVSLVSAVDGKWHQTYVDSPGGRLVLIGALESNGTMLLYVSATERNGWTLIDPNHVRYYGERTTNGGQSWTLTFDARYTRR